jgi:signal peptidase I
MKLRRWQVVVVAILVALVIIKRVVFSCIRYNNYKVRRGVFTPHEVDVIRANYGKDPPGLDALLKQRLAHLTQTDFLHVGSARVSDNNNKDGQSYHRDLKPILSSRGLAKDYTVIFYFDPAVTYMGGERVEFQPGDVIMFPSVNLHKAGDISVHKQKHRRVVQFFEVHLTPEESRKYYEQTTHCENYPAAHDFLKDWVYPWLDARALVEALNVSWVQGWDCNKTGKRAVRYHTKSKIAYTLGETGYYTDF